MHKSYEETFSFELIDGYGTHQCVVAFEYYPGAPAKEGKASEDSDIIVKALQANVAKEGQPPEILDLTPLLKNEDIYDYLQGEIYSYIISNTKDLDGKYDSPIEEYY